MVNIEGLSKPSVLARLYNKSRGVGIGVYQYNKDHKMTYREAERLLESQSTFDLVFGRPLYITIDENTTELDNTKYDKFLKEEGKMQKVIDELREQKSRYNK